MSAVCLVISLWVSVHADASTFGYPTIGSSQDTGDSNYINAWKFTTSSTQSGTITAISVYIAGPVSAAPSNQYQVALYADAGTEPGALLASSASSRVLDSSRQCI